MWCSELRSLNYICWMFLKLVGIFFVVLAHLNFSILTFNISFNFHSKFFEIWDFKKRKFLFYLGFGSGSAKGKRHTGNLCEFLCNVAIRHPLFLGSSFFPDLNNHLPTCTWLMKILHSIQGKKYNKHCIQQVFLYL